MLLFEEEVSQPASQWSFGFHASVPGPGVDPGDNDVPGPGPTPDDDDDQADPGGDSDVTPDPARAP